MLRRRRPRARPAPESPAADAPAGGRGEPAHDRLVTPDGVELWYRWAGPEPDATDQPVLVVPTCGNAADFDGLVTGSRPVLYYDVRNRGRSSTVPDPRRLGFHHELDDLAMVCDRLSLDRVSLLGWSYHAGVVSQFALAQPDRVDRLVLAAAIPPRSALQPSTMPEAAPHELAHLDQLRAAGIPQSEPERWCAEWRRVYVPLRMGDPSAFGRLTSPCSMRNEHPDHMARALVFVLADLGPYDWGHELRGLAAPVLVIHGTADADPIESADEWIRAVPDGRLLALEGVGQLPWAEAPEQFFSTVDRFLSGTPV
jgi:pimeloyl-ACP methyl ester carboxylesterase